MRIDPLHTAAETKATRFGERSEVEHFAVPQRVVMTVLLLEILSLRDDLIFTKVWNLLQIRAARLSWPKRCDRN